MGILNLSFNDLFDLTPYQFTQLFEGYQDRERVDAIKRAEIIATLYNVNQFTDHPKTVRISDILPWFDEYVNKKTGRSRIPQQISRVIDESEPQIDRITRRLLEQKGIDPDTIDRDSEEWKQSAQLASACLTGGTGTILESDESGIQAISFRKADPAVWGTPPWEKDEAKEEEQ